MSPEFPYVEKFRELLPAEQQKVVQNLEHWMEQHTENLRALFPSALAILTHPEKSITETLAASTAETLNREVLITRLWFVVAGLIEQVRTPPLASGEESRAPAALIRDEYIGWAHTHIKPLIADAMQNGLRDLSALAKAENSLPEADQTHWRNAVQSAQKALDTLQQREPDTSLDIRARVLLHHLNAFFLQAGLLMDVLASYPSTQDSTLPADIDTRVRINMIDNRNNMPSAEGTIPVFHLIPTHQPKQNSNIAYAEVASGSVRLDRRTFDSFIKTQDYLARPECLERDEADRAFARWISKRYPDISERAHAYYSRIVIEEVRHVLDQRRMMRIGSSYESIDQAVLRQGASLRENLWTSLLQEYQEGMFLRNEESITTARAIMEISAQLTAAGVCEDPAIIAQEWKQNISKRMLESGRQVAVPAKAHDLSAEVIVALLATQAKLVDGMSFSPERSNIFQKLWRKIRGKKILQFGDHDLAFLETLAEKLATAAEESKSQFRLWNKRAFESIFQAPIDEEPFDQITETGELRRRFADSPA